MELNQEKLMADHPRLIKMLFTKLEKCDEELESKKVNHFDQVATMQNHLIPMEANHKEENYDEVINDMKIGFQNKLSAIEERHDEEVKIMKTNHSNQMATIEEKCAREMEAMKSSMYNYLISIKTNHDKVINNMEVGQICLQNKFWTMEQIHAKEICPYDV